MTTCALIPTYNNVTTIADVVTRTLHYLPVIVVVDGSTDGTAEVVASLAEQHSDIQVIRLEKNSGKGFALKQGFRKAAELGYSHVLTLDADGQHNPDDIPALMRMAAIRPESIIVGSRIMAQANKPKKNTFANRFSNFWFAVQTGLSLPDTQSGFRIYPLSETHGIALMTRRYEAELLLLVLSTWACTPVVPVPIEVYYPPEEERVSFFHPAKDFTRISLLNTLLCLVAVVYGYPRRYWRLAYWGNCFFCFAFWANIVSFIHLFNPSKKKSEQLRRIYARGIRFFLGMFPQARLRLHLAPGATPIEENRPSVYIANHCSLVDILIMLTLHRRMVVIGKDYVVHNIFFGRVARALGVITIGTGIENILPTLDEYVRKGYSIAIFPEGTRSLDGELLRFHRGAFYVAEQLHIPIRPILLHGMGLAFPKITLLVGRPKELSVTILPEIAPDDTTFGVGYRERTRNIRAYYYKLIDRSKEE